MAKQRTTYTVGSPTGLNVRQHPAKNAPILRVLPYGEKVGIDPTIEAPEGWKALLGDGFVMGEYLK